MTPLSITSSTNMVDHRATALEFDSTFASFRSLLQGLDAEPTRGNSLRRVYVMFNFDPCRTEHLRVPRYFGRRKEAEIVVGVDSASFGRLDTDGRMRLLCGTLISALEIVRESLEGKVAHELDELISAISDLDLGAARLENRQGGGTEFTVASASSDDSPTGQRKPQPLADNPTHQLVVQLPESLFPDTEKMFGLEEEIAAFLSGEAKVDGNDVGEGRFNVGTNKRVAEVLPPTRHLPALSGERRPRRRESGQH